MMESLSQVPAMLRLGYDRAAHHVALTLVGSASSSTRFLPNSTLQAAGVDALNGVGDGIATWRGQWPFSSAQPGFGSCRTPERAAGEIAKSLRTMIVRHGLDATAAKPVVKCASYLVQNARWLHYDRALADCLPIATGVIEGACRHLVQDRMGRTGARWSLTGAEATLRLRALRASGDFDDYWQFHLAKEHERTHQSRYADGVVPNPLPSHRPHLKLVK